MNKKNLMMAFGVVALIFGIGFLVAPATMAEIYDLPTENLQSNLVARFFGSTLIAVSVMNFFASTGGATRPVIYGDIVGCVLGIVATVIWMGSDLNVDLMWLNIVIYGVFGLAFIYLEFVKK